MRLEPSDFVIPEMDSIFQFHKGAIRTLAAYNLQLDLLHFNSIKVRLELTLNGLLIHLLKFQFHKGAIRTSSRRSFILLHVHFNSIKVRLEL